MQRDNLVCERGTINFFNKRYTVYERGIKKGKGLDFRGYISVATKEVQVGTSAR